MEATRVGRVVAPECPLCGRQVFLTLDGPVVQPDGTTLYDGTLAQAGLMIHLRVGCEASE